MKYSSVLKYGKSSSWPASQAWRVTGGRSTRGPLVDRISRQSAAPQVPKDHPDHRSKGEVNTLWENRREEREDHGRCWIGVDCTCTWVHVSWRPEEAGGFDC